MTTDEHYMRRCLELARMAEGQTSPNPLVGAVIVCDDRIIGEGYHHKAGWPHAEVEAVRSVHDKELLKRSTIYVSLEPCSHYGKTPPCAELIIRKKIPRVVMAMHDPFPEVSGRGEKMLREAGVEVACGILEAEARELNRFFLTAVEKKRPYVTLKWARSADGFMDKKRNSSTIPPICFSSPVRMREVHRMRMTHDAILVGYRTALLDNPKLNNRYWPGGKTPLRIVLDRNKALPDNLHLFDGSIATLRIIDSTIKRIDPIPGVEHWQTDFSQPFLPALLKKLHEINIRSLMVEGGAKTLALFIKSNLYDRIDEEVNPIYLSEGISAPVY